MAAPSKQSSRWGSFLQQAVAGVESRLDNILVGEDFQKPETPVKASPVITKLETEPARISLTANSTNDRLQERLARAIAAKNYAAQKTENHASSSNVPSRVESPATIGGSPRLSLDKVSSKREDAMVEWTLAQSGGGELRATVEIESVGSISEQCIRATSSNSSSKASSEESRLPVDLNPPSILGQSTDTPQPTMEVKSMNENGDHGPVGDEERRSLQIQTEQELSQKRLQDDLDDSDMQRQEGIHGYIEQIDSLQAKLIYLSRESAESARKAAALAPSASIEKRLAEKDEQIALLMEEGQKLSKTELKHMTIIKKLRAKASETEREMTEAMRRVEKTEGEKIALLERLKRAEAAEKQTNEKQKALVRAQKEIEVLIVERDTKTSAIAELKAQLSESASQSKANEAKAAQDLLGKERRRLEELENALSLLRTEKELEAGRAKVRIDELQAINKREAERARVVEVEQRAEQQALESKLEVLRTRAEEVSSGAVGDAQAKLLRQIETLQTQYAVATENWQGIEASLASRATSLEKERDEVLKREIDIRRKAREVTLKSKRVEDDLEVARNSIRSLQEELTERMSQLDKLHRRTEVAELALIEARRNFDQEKQAFKSEMLHRIDEERVRWQEEFMGHTQAEFPTTSYKGLTAEHLGLQNLQAQRTPARPFSNELPIMERHVNRKSSAQQFRSSGRATPQREDSTLSFTGGETSDIHSLHAMEHDEYFENVTSPSSPHHIMQDAFSISTVGAGPSVQFVERMSAAVRRLESEKVSTKEELARLSAQRDEARAQIVALMQQIEVRRALDKRVQELEEENKNINARYQTTLEMLGEKSELVEELKADVQDMKDMYRELVEQTVK